MISEEVIVKFWRGKTEPLVSVICPTYNHQDFIRDAIDGFLKQVTDFPFEVIIHDDMSTDTTANIIREYKERYPKIIQTIFQKENQFSKGRRILPIVLPHAKGKYIALCEGDDYWIDPYKLQKQFEFLDNNKDFASCFHWAGWLLENKKKITHWEYGPPIDKTYYTIDDLLEHGNFIPTCSILFRSNIIEELPDWYNYISIGDLPLHILNAMKGKIGFIDEKMAVYRRHRGGFYSGNLKYKNIKTTIDALELLGSKLDLSRKNSFKIGLSNFYGKLSGAYIEEVKFKEAFNSAYKSVFIATAGYKTTAAFKILDNIGHIMKRNIGKRTIKWVF